MEEWEDLLEEELGETIDKYLKKGLTVRQILGVLVGLTAMYTPTVIEFDPE